MEIPDDFLDPEASFISTGNLPPADLVTRLLGEAHERFAPLEQGDVSQVYPALARVPPEKFGICAVSTNGRVFSVGDAEHEFTIMSVSKPFIFALICDIIGATGARERIGANATGLCFQFDHRGGTRS